MEPTINDEGDGLRGGNRVYQDLLRRILRGDLTSGSRLPIEQELAEQYDVARSTLRRALDRLRNDKLIVSRQGDGHYVAGFAVGDRIEIQVRADCTFNDLFDVRKHLDSMAAAQAAIAPAPESLTIMRDAIDAMRLEMQTKHINLINIRRIDIEFHQAIADCSKNMLLRGLIDAHAAALGPYWLVWMELDETMSRLITEQTFKDHNLIYAAIEAGNPEAAEHAMRSHYATSFASQESLAAKPTQLSTQPVNLGD